MRVDDIVHASHVDVGFEGKNVLHDISFHITKGEFVALLGANGSGKSTLIRTLLGLEHPSHGHVSLFNQNVDAFGQWNRIAYVPQRLLHASSIPVSVADVVSSGRVGSWPRFGQRSATRRAVDEALQAVHLTERKKDRLSTLSGGQQRRALIARALATSAEFFVMDEPTAGVDAASQRELVGIFRTLMTRGATVLIVTHELGPLTSLVTRSLVLDDGRLVFDGAEVPEHYLHDHVHHHAEEPVEFPEWPEE